MGEQLHKPCLSSVPFGRKDWSPEDYGNCPYKNQWDGFALVTPSKWKRGATYETVARFCNPDTTEEDIAAILKTME